MLREALNYIGKRYKRVETEILKDISDVLVETIFHSAQVVRIVEQLVETPVIGGLSFNTAKML